MEPQAASGQGKDRAPHTRKRTSPGSMSCPVPACFPPDCHTRPTCKPHSPLHRRRARLQPPEPQDGRRLSWARLVTVWQGLSFDQKMMAATVTCYVLVGVIYGAVVLAIKFPAAAAAAVLTAAGVSVVLLRRRQQRGQEQEPRTAESPPATQSESPYHVVPVPGPGHGTRHAAEIPAGAAGPARGASLWASPPVRPAVAQPALWTAPAPAASGHAPHDLRHLATLQLRPPTAPPAADGAAAAHAAVPAGGYGGPGLGARGYMPVPGYDACALPLGVPAEHSGAYSAQAAAQGMFW